MAENKQYKFSHKEVVEALIKKQGLTSGIWRLSVDFGLGAANIANPTSGEVLPVAFVPLQRIGLIQAESEDNLSVDAAKVRAKPSQTKKRTARVAHAKKSSRK